VYGGLSGVVMGEDGQVLPTPPASIGSLVVMGDSFTEGLEDDLGV